MGVAAKGAFFFFGCQKKRTSLYHAFSQKERRTNSSSNNSSVVTRREDKQDLHQQKNLFPRSRTKLILTSGKEFFLSLTQGPFKFVANFSLSFPNQKTKEGKVCKDIYFSRGKVWIHLEFIGLFLLSFFYPPLPE